MKSNALATPPQNWSPTDRMLWLAKHCAPSNMRLATDLELHVVGQALESERKKALAYEARAATAEAKVARAIADTDSFLTLLQSLANHMDDNTGLAIIYAEADRVAKTLTFLKAPPCPTSSTSPSASQD